MMASGRVPRSERRVRSDGTPFGIRVGLGVTAVLCALFVAALLPPFAGGWRLAPVALVLVAMGGLTVDPAAVALVATLAYLPVIGFLVNQLGVLSWHGAPDFVRILVITASSGVGLCLGVFRRRWHHRRPLTIPEEWLAIPNAQLPSSKSNG